MKRFALSIIAFLCLLGWDAPAFAQNYDNKLATYRARMRKENPFRCYFKGQVFAIDEFHEKPFRWKAPTCKPTAPPTPPK